MVLHEAHQGATHSGEILKTAVLHPSLESFLSSYGHGTRIAFSARDGTGKRISDFATLLRTLRTVGDKPHPIFDPELITQLHFGTEDDGLSLEELEPMNFICRLPSTDRIPSFNLSHAVLLALYILKAASEQESPSKKLLMDDNLNSASSTDSRVANEEIPYPLIGRMEYPKRAIREWLEVLGFDLDSRRVSIETSLNRILLSHCPSLDDVRLLEKVLFQTVEKLKSQVSNEPKGKE